MDILIRPLFVELASCNISCGVLSLASPGGSDT